MRDSERNREWQREWRAKNPEKVKKFQSDANAQLRSALATIKLEAGCIDCGYNEHPEALTFDHITGIKTMNVSSWKSITGALKEIEECEVVCANCHAVRTAICYQEARAV